MKKFAMFSALAAICTALVFAQADRGEFPEPNHDELTAYLGLTDTQLTCLESNRTAFRDAAASSFEKLRDLQRQLRQATRNAEDTTAIQSEIEAERTAIQSVQTTHVASARACLDSAQQTQIGQLVQAETLMNEVHDGIGLLLLSPTEARPEGFRGGPPRGPHGGPR